MHDLTVEYLIEVDGKEMSIESLSPEQMELLCRRIQECFMDNMGYQKENHAG